MNTNMYWIIGGVCIVAVCLIVYFAYFNKESYLNLADFKEDIKYKTNLGYLTTNNKILPLSSGFTIQYHTLADNKYKYEVYLNLPVAYGGDYIPSDNGELSISEYDVYMANSGSYDFVGKAGRRNDGYHVLMFTTDKIYTKIKIQLKNMDILEGKI